MSHITPPSGISFCRRSWQYEKRDGVVQTGRVVREPRKRQAETKTKQGLFEVLGKHESEGTPHQAVDRSAPPVSVLGERELEEARRKGKEGERWKLGKLERGF